MKSSKTSKVGIGTIIGAYTVYGELYAGFREFRAQGSAPVASGLGFAAESPREVVSHKEKHKTWHADLKPKSS